MGSSHRAIWDEGWESINACRPQIELYVHIMSILESLMNANYLHSTGSFIISVFHLKYLLADILWYWKIYPDEL